MRVDTRLGRAVALKFLNRQFLADSSERLVREARAAARLDHPNICSIYEVVDDERRCFIVMQYVEGETLAARIARSPIDVREALEIASQIADALAEAHAKGVVHRDVKPQNIMITPRGQAKVLDFGLAESVTQIDPFISEVEEPERVSATEPIAGTVAYMSPEQASGQALDARSDMFSFGVMLYELLAGRRPFVGKTDLETLQKVIHEAPLPLGEELPRGAADRGRQGAGERSRRAVPVDAGDGGRPAPRSPPRWRHARGDAPPGNVGPAVHRMVEVGRGHWSWWRSLAVPGRCGTRNHPLMRLETTTRS